MAEWLSKISGVFKRGKPLEEALPDMLDPGDPRVVIRVLGNDWLCPYTAQRIETPDWNGSSLTLLQCEAIRSHLLAQPELQKLSSLAQMKPFEELVSIAVFQRVQYSDNYKFTAPSGEWVCPYCIQKTEILLRNWDGTDVPMKFFFQQMLKHFADCAEYQQDPVGGAKTTLDIKEEGGDRAKLTKSLARDPRFKICDPSGAWLCPFAARTVAQFNLHKEPWDRLQPRLLDYMLSGDCPGRYTQYNVERTMEDLQKAATTKHVSF